MKYLYCVLTCLLAGHWAEAQEWALKGSLGFPGGESFTYELHLTEEVNGTLRGYSLLYAQPGNETRASLVGHINREAKTLDISEQSIDYSRNFESRAYICRLSASLTYHPYASAGRPGLFGVTGANEYNDNRCNSGTLSFIASDALRKFFTEKPVSAVVSSEESTVPEVTAKQLPLPQPLPKPEAKSATPAPKAEVPELPVKAPPPTFAIAAPKASRPATEYLDQPAIENMPANQKPSVRRFYFPKKEKKVIPEPPKPRDTTGGLHLIAGEAADITCKSEVLEVLVFDGSGKVDGDQVTLQYNERTLLKNYALRATTQPLRLPLGKGGRLQITAVSEGSDKPCTGYVYIKDGERLHRFVVELEKGKEAAVILHREDQP